MGWRTSPELVKTSHALIQATPFCNIDCTYCYLPNRNEKRVMPLGLLRKFCSELIENGALAPTLRVSWHIGEPLALPHAEFDAQCGLIREMLTPHTRVTLSLQTNAMLLDAAWIELIRRYEIRVGVSLDGPKQYHDAHRVTRRGKGTFNAVMRGVEQLKRGGVGFGVICVLTPESLRAPDAMFDFFFQNGIDDVSFNVEESIGVNKSRRRDTEDFRRCANAFFRRYFERASAEGVQHRVRELSNILDACRGPKLEFTTQVSQPGRVLSLSATGRVSTFSPELLTWGGSEAGRFEFVDLNTAPLSALAASPDFIDTNREILAGLERCRNECRYFRFCGGGSPAVKFGEAGRFNVTETSQCQAKVMASVDAFLDLMTDGCRQ